MPSSLMSVGEFRLLTVLVCLTTIFHVADADAGRRGSVTGLEIPRFVSLEAAKARLRVGPGARYPIKWLYLQRGLPLEVIAEYGNWRRVRDHEGDTGWMHHSLLSGRRSAMAAPWLKAGIEMYEAPSESRRMIARLGAGVLLALDVCDGAWCRATLLTRKDTTGWVMQGNLWGVYPGERVRN